MKQYYTTLGIPEDATQKEIKQAYQKLAQTLHPDKPTGNAEEFTKLLEAYMVLRSPERRKQYDETGDATYVNLRQKAISQVASAYLNWVVNNMGEPERNAIRELTSEFNGKIATANAQIRKITHTLEQLSKHGEFIQAPEDSEDLFAMVQAKMHSEASAQKEGLEKDIEIFQKVLEILAEYKFLKEETARIAPQGMGGFASAWQTFP